MRLLDQVVQASATLDIVDGTGVRAVPAAGERAAAVRACPLRYVLEADVAAACRELSGRLAGAAIALRMPAASFWIEWAEADGRRTGVLAAADPGGRSGTIEAFWEQPQGEPDRAQLLLRFDFDHDLAGAADGGARLALTRGEHPLAAHLLFELDPRWAAHFHHLGPAAAREPIRHAAAAVMPACEMAVAFALLLSARSAVATTDVDRSRLNRARERAGRTPLLDHLEVRMTLDAEADRVRDAAAGQRRGPARLHQVRGHFVHRGGQLFWRRSHARGSPTAAILSRTVLVAYAGRQRGPSADARSL